MCHRSRPVDAATSSLTRRTHAGAGNQKGCSLPWARLYRHPLACPPARPVLTIGAKRPLPWGATVRRPADTPLAPWTAAPTPLGDPTSGRARPRPVHLGVLAAAVAVSVLAGGCGHGNAGSRRSPPASPRTATTVDERNAAVTATAAFRAVVGAASSSLVADVGRLQADLETGDTAAARRDELTAQGHYDRIRLLVAGNAVNASALDQRVVDVPVGQAPGGLHAVERDLWSADGAISQTRSHPLGQALADAGGLTAQAPVAEFLLSRASLDPQAIGTLGVDELGWVNDMALPGREELYSHLDAVDVVATVDAAGQAFAAIQPLGTLVNPSLTGLVAGRFATLATEVSALGPAEQMPDAAIDPATRLTLSRQVDATAAGLSQLAGGLVPFGTSGGPS